MRPSVTMISASVSSNSAAGVAPPHNVGLRTSMSHSGEPPNAPGQSARVSHWQTEQSLRFVIDSLREHAVFTTDPAGIITSWHANAEGLLGWTSAEALGKDVQTICTPEDRLNGSDRHEMDRAAAEGCSADERWRLKKNGARFWGSGMIYPLRDEASQLIGFVRILTDGTEEHLRHEQAQTRKEELEQAVAIKTAELCASDERWAATFQHAALGMSLVDPLTGRFLEINDMLSQQLGYTIEELRAQSFYDITHPEDVPENRRLFEDLVAERIPQFSLIKRIKRRDGSLLWIKLNAALARDANGRPKHVVCVVEDVTAHLNAEQALRNTNAELRKANAELEQFAFVASHDLQEPLRTINVYTQMFLRRYDTGQDPVAKQYAGYIVENVARMQRLIEDLLDYSRTIHTEKHEQYLPAPVDLNAALQDAFTTLHHQIHDAGAIITQDPLPVVKGDRELVAQVFQNLISNALKFRCKDEQTRIHIFSPKQGGDPVVCVQDNGIGFEEKYSERIFGLFKRLHRTEYAGTGLGLAIARRIINRYGGKIWATSELGNGSCFFFSLPAADPL